MVIQMSPNCRTALTAVVAVVTIIGALLTATTIAIDGRIAQALQPVREDMAVLKRQMQDVKEDVQWLVRQQSAPK